MAFAAPLLPCTTTAGDTVYVFCGANSEHVQQMQLVFREIADYNKLDPQIIYRMNANAMNNIGRN